MRERNWNVYFIENSMGGSPRSANIDEVEFDNRREAEAYAREFNSNQPNSGNIWYRANVSRGSRR